MHDTMKVHDYITKFYKHEKKVFELYSTHGIQFYFKRTKRKAKNKSPHFVLQSTFLGKRNYGTMKYARGCQ